MESDLIRYFTGEKNGSLCFLLCGVLALAVSIYLLRGTESLRMMAIPLSLVGLLQVGVGGSVLARTDGQVAALKDQLGTAPGAMKQAEQTRMKKVMRSFEIIKITEIVILAIGLLLALRFRHSDALWSIGIGCILQASASLSLDLFAERRGEFYLSALDKLSG